jgi:hypothetical protein
MILILDITGDFIVDFIALSWAQLDIHLALDQV